MNNLYVDIETYSGEDIRTAGLHRYAQSPDFEVILLGYALNDEPASVVDLISGEELPARIKDLLTNPECVKHARNAVFEWQCLSRYLGEDPMRWLGQWRCTMIHCLYCGFPASLADAGEAVGLEKDAQKLRTGTLLINTFCKPIKPTNSNGGRTRCYPWHEPGKWELFKEYNRRDVVADREIARKLENYTPPKREQKLWELDAAINSRGIGVDIRLVDGAINCSSEITEKLSSEASVITGLDNPGSVAKLKDWLEKETSASIHNLQKATVEGLLNGGIEGKARRILEIRRETSKTSIKKYEALARGVCADGRARGLMQFYGAGRTGRWAGRRVQIHNLPRNYLETLDLARECVKAERLDKLSVLYSSVPDTLSQLIRTAFVPAAGAKYIVADFSAIEARIIAWLAGEEWVNEVFRTHGKIYEACAAQMFNVPIERITKGNPEYALRQKGKAATLALGYQGGPPALIAQGALKMGLKEEELPGIVKSWRQANPNIVRLWYKYERAARDAVKTGIANSVGTVTFAREADPKNGLDFMTVTLPAGRKLFYARPHICSDSMGRDKLCYIGKEGTKWAAQETYGGKLAENVTQAIARDCLADAMTKLEAAGYPIVAHIHDEVVCEVRRDDSEHTLENAVKIMSEPLLWAPGLTLKAAGFESQYYKKD